MRRVSMATRDDLVAAVIERYSKGRRAEKGRILDEFVAVTGFHRKHAVSVLRGGQAKRCSAPRPERRLYDEAVREALIVIWEASDRVCGKRLKARPFSWRRWSGTGISSSLPRSARAFWR